MTVRELLNYKISIDTDTLYYDCYYFYNEKDYLQLCKNKNSEYTEERGEYFSFVVSNYTCVTLKYFLENEV